MQFISAEAEVRASLNTMALLVSQAAVPAEVRDAMRVQLNSLDAASTSLVEERNSHAETLAQLRELLGKGELSGAA